MQGRTGSAWAESLSPVEPEREAVLNSSREVNYLSARGRFPRRGKTFLIRRIFSFINSNVKFSCFSSHDVVDLRKMKPHRFLPSLCIAGRLLYASFMCSDGKLFSDNEKMKLFIFIALDTESLRFIRTSWRHERKILVRQVLLSCWLGNSMTPTQRALPPPGRLLGRQQQRHTPTKLRPGGMTGHDYILSAFTFIWRHGGKLIEKSSHEIFIAMNLRVWSRCREQLFCHQILTIPLARLLILQLSGFMNLFRLSFNEKKCRE